MSVERGRKGALMQSTNFTGKENKDHVIFSSYCLISRELEGEGQLSVTNQVKLVKKTLFK